MPIDTTKPPLSGTAAAIVGGIGAVAVVAHPFIPSPWGTLVLIAGGIMAALAGFAAKPPQFAAGKPVLQGSALALVGSLEGIITHFYTMAPPGWIQSIVGLVIALLAWLGGKAAPQLGSPTVEQLKQAEAAGQGAADAVATKADAVSVFQKGPQP